jgi:hypothetical protein
MRVELIDDARQERTRVRLYTAYDDHGAKGV